MNVLTDQQRNSIRSAILNADAYDGLKVPWRGMTAEQVAALSDNELRVYGSWMHSISDAVGQAMVAAGLTGNREMITNDRVCSGCGGEPGSCTCKPTPTPTGNAEGAEGLEARFVIHAVGDSCFMTTLGEDGSLPFEVDDPPARPTPSYRGAAGPAPIVMNEEAGPVVSSEMMDSLFRNGFESRLAFNRQLRSRTDRVVKDAAVLGDGLVPGVAPRERSVTVNSRVDKANLDYLPAVSAADFGWPR